MHVWSKLSGVKWVDAWEERFHGNANAVISEIKGGKSVRVEVYCETEGEAEAIQKQFGGSVRELKTQNWVAMSAPKSEPVIIRDRLIISQDPENSKQLQNAHPKKQLITIPPEMAFGTGDHPTTSTCLRFLVDAAAKQGAGWSFLDAGTGSGLLAIAAHKLGAEKTLGFDFDPKAVEVGQTNLARNAAESVQLIEADVLDWENQEEFDIMAANLFSTILLQAIPRMPRWVRLDGRLILSGILHTQWGEVQKMAEEHGFSLDEKRRIGKWVTALFTRRK